MALKSKIAALCAFASVAGLGGALGHNMIHDTKEGRAAIAECLWTADNSCTAEKLAEAKTNQQMQYKSLMIGGAGLPFGLAALALAPMGAASGYQNHGRSSKSSPHEKSKPVPKK